MADIRKCIDVETLDDGLYRGTNLWKPAAGRSVFGGQVVAQALHSAIRTIDISVFVPVSMHCYFLLPGNPAAPIFYKVERVRDGKSFSTREVVAFQKNRPILKALLAFQTLDSSASAVQHAYAPPPHVPDPETVPDLKARIRSILADERLPPEFRPQVEAHLHDGNPLDVRYCRKSDPLAAQPDIPIQCIWMRCNEIDEPSHAPRAPGEPYPASLSARVWHYCAAAFASDFALLGTAMLPHRSPNPGVSFMASLDHSIWFHAPFRADDWMLYEIESPRLVHGRGFAVGRIFRADGTLVISTAQEGVIRFHADWTPEAPIHVVRKTAAAGIVWDLESEEADGSSAASGASRPVAFGFLQQPSPTWGSVPPSLEKQAASLEATGRMDPKL